MVLRASRSVVVLRLVIRRKNASNLDEPLGALDDSNGNRSFELDLDARSQNSGP
jgi:hypothetical protein